MDENGFKVVLLGDIISFANGKAIKAKYNGEYSIYGSNGKIGFSDEFKFENGIIIGRVGAYCGSVFYSDGKFWASDNTIVATPADKTNDIKFLYYLLIYLNLNDYAGGSAQPLLTQKNLKLVQTRVPDIRIQKIISSILSNYDNLIENNMVRINILEQMAQNIFEEWFIKFQFPESEHVELINSKFGMLPIGWVVKKLGDVCEFKYGKSLPKKIRITGEYPVYGSGGLIDHHESPLTKGPGIIIGRKGSIGTIFYEMRDFFPIDTVFFITESESEVALEFLYYLLKTLNLDKLNSDAAVPGLNRNEAHQKEVIIPPSKLIGDFQKIINALFDLRHNLQEKNKNLRQTRDLLLFKLISGEISVENLKINSRGIGT